MSYEQSMSYWRGRRLAYDPDAQAIEQERQKWVYEKTESLNGLIADLTVRDPRSEYARHRDEYERTGDLTAFLLMLEYVQA